MSASVGSSAPLAVRFTPRAPLAVRDVSLSSAARVDDGVIGKRIGKSTLIRMLAGLLRHVGGQILLDGVRFETGSRDCAPGRCLRAQVTSTVFPFEVIDVVSVTDARTRNDSVS